MPRKIIARIIPQINEKERKRLLSEIFSLYFPDLDINSVVLNEIKKIPENLPGIMAAYAFHDRISEFRDSIEKNTEDNYAESESSLLDELAHDFVYKV